MNEVHNDSASYDVLVCGAGPAGMAAAAAAARCGCRNVLLVDRESYLGGVLSQCIHDGFGLELTGSSLTGPEYALRLRAELADTAVEIACETSVVDIAAPEHAGKPCRVMLVGPMSGGTTVVEATTVILATGCRERTRGQLRIPGSRPAGVLTAGSAQYLLNICGKLVGDKVVILGSGDIGLIMARRLTLEGAQVRLVLGQEATGLYRNHVQCIEEFGIPIRYGWTVAAISGRGRIKGVTVAPFAADGAPDLSRREYIRCNALLIATGLIPERDLLAGLPPQSWSRAADATEETPILLAGNVSQIHDLVDAAVVEATVAGIRAAARAAKAQGTTFEVPPSLADIAARHIENAPGARMTGVGSADVFTSVCTLCPRGCALEIERDEQGGARISGAGCDRGEQDILSSLEHPLRAFTGSVRIDGAVAPLLPVRTSAPVPQEALMSIARQTRHLVAHPPIHAGDIIMEDVAGTGADLIATDDREEV